MSFAILDSAIIHSTIWLEPHHVRILWITMLAIKDKDGIVKASVPNLARAAVISRVECEDGLQRLSSPDPDSRSDEYEGRRIERIDGGWRILNHDKYRSQINKEHTRLRQQRHRQSVTERDMSRPVTNVTTDQIRSQQIISDKNAIYKQDIEIESSIGQDNVVENEHTLTSVEGQRIAELIISLWPSYSIYAHESAAKLITDPRFQSLDLEQCIRDAAATFPPGRGCMERNGVHGFIIAYLQNSVERQSRSARKSADENQRDRNREILQRVGEKNDK